MDIDMILAIVRVFAGVVIAGHGAQKVFGMFGGPGLEKWTAGVRQMGFRPAGLWANAAAWGELVGGLMLAAGFLTGIAAGVLLVDMVVAIWKVHWKNGFWITNGGMEHSLSNAVIYGFFGIVGAGLYSLDAPLRLVSWTTLLFAGTVLFALFGIWAGSRPEAVRVTRADEVRRRRAA